MPNTLFLHHNHIESVLKTALQHYASISGPLQAAMEYSVLAPSKRIRPLLVYAAGRAIGAPIANLDAAACALEFMHTYSLIHDDLPCMDNSALRRGKPTCHIVFGEATAVLAGDALQALAFHIISDYPAPELSATQRLNMLKILAAASGSQGMVAGQTFDIKQQAKTLAQLTQLNSLKTGALIVASVKLAIAAATLEDPRLINALETYANALGQAFQIQDDILDIEGSVEITGKSIQLDAAQQKITYPALLGITAAKQKLIDLYETAQIALQAFTDQAPLLHELLAHLKQRQK